MKETFNYAAPFMGEIVIITLKTPTVERINSFFSAQRRILRTGSSDMDDAVDTLRSSFFDELFSGAEVTQGAERVKFEGDIPQLWKQSCILQAFEKVGQIKN